MASLADPRCGSVLESLLRVLLWVNGLPAPRTQYVFRLSRGSSYRADFAYVVAVVRAMLAEGPTTASGTANSALSQAA